MQRPCERENRAGTSIETRANVSMRRNIAHITSNRNDLQKKKKKENRIPLAVCVSLKFDRCPARNQSPREISKRGPRACICMSKGRKSLPPSSRRVRKSLLTVRAWFARLRLRSDSPSLFSRPRVFLRLSVRRRPFSPSEGGEERRAFRVKERSRRRGFAMRGGSRVLSSRGNA